MNKEFILFQGYSINIISKSIANTKMYFRHEFGCNGLYFRVQKYIKSLWWKVMFKTSKQRTKTSDNSFASENPCL